MSENLFAQLVGKHFGYLLSEYGFSLAEETFAPKMMGNASTLLESDHTGVMIVVDRSQVLITIGPMSAPQRDWFEFSDVVHCFAPEIEPVYIFPADSGDWSVELEAQVSRLAEIMRAYCSPILRGDFSAQTEIKRIEQQRVATMLATWSAAGKNVVMPEESRGVRRLVWLFRRYLAGQAPRVSAQTALQIARVEFKTHGWYWLEPVRVRGWWGNWEIHTNIGSRGANGYVRISQETGQVKIMSFAPR